MSDYLYEKNIQLASHRNKCKSNIKLLYIFYIPNKMWRHGSSKCWQMWRQWCMVQCQSGINVGSGVNGESCLSFPHWAKYTFTIQFNKQSKKKSIFKILSKLFTISFTIIFILYGERKIIPQSFLVFIPPNLWMPDDLAINGLAINGFIDVSESTFFEFPRQSRLDQLKLSIFIGVKGRQENQRLEGMMQISSLRFLG